MHHGKFPSSLRNLFWVWLMRWYQTCPQVYQHTDSKMRLSRWNEIAGGKCLLFLVYFWANLENSWSMMMLGSLLQLTNKKLKMENSAPTVFPVLSWVFTAFMLSETSQSYLTLLIPPGNQLTGLAFWYTMQL